MVNKLQLVKQKALVSYIRLNGDLENMARPHAMFTAPFLH